MKWSEIKALVHKNIIPDSAEITIGYDGGEEEISAIAVFKTDNRVIFMVDSLQAEDDEAVMEAIDTELGSCCPPWEGGPKYDPCVAEAV